MPYTNTTNRGIVVGGSKSIAASRSQLQSNYNYVNKQSPTSKQTPCELFVQDICKDPNCIFTHNNLLKKRLIAEKKKLLQKCGIGGKISGKSVCFFYTTGDICHKLALCRFLHDDALCRRVELKMKAIKANKVGTVNVHTGEVDKVKVNSVEQLSDWDDPAIYAHWKEITEPVKTVNPMEANKSRADLAAQTSGWDDHIAYSHWDKVRESKVFSPPPSPDDSPNTSFSIKPIVSTNKKNTQSRGQKLIPQLRLSTKHISAPRQEPTPPPTPCESHKTYTTQTTVSSSQNAGYKTLNGYRTIMAVNGPTIQPWATIPSHWESWARRNLEPADHAAIRPFIENGMLDHGIMPIELLSAKCKNAHIDAKFPKFMLLPYELREIIWKKAVAGETGYEVRVEFKYELEAGNMVKPRFKPSSGTSGLLCACFESRMIARKRYSRAFATHYSPAVTYINFKKDGLFLNVRYPSDWFKMIPHIDFKCVGLIRTLILPMRDFIKGNAQVTKLIFGFISDCRNLTHLHLIAGDGKEDAVIDFQGHENKIRRVVHSYFKRFHPNRKMGLPKVILRIIPATTAHMYKIDGLIW